MKRKIVVGVSASVALGISALVVSAGYLREEVAVPVANAAEYTQTMPKIPSVKKESQSSVQLAPKMNIELAGLDTKADSEDVIKTFSKEEMKASTNKALEQINVDVSKVLGDSYTEEEYLTYRNKVKDYNSRIYSAGIKENDQEEVDSLVADFNSWSADFRKTKKDEEEKEALRLQRELEEQQALAQSSVVEEETVKTPLKYTYPKQETKTISNPEPVVEAQTIYPTKETIPDTGAMLMPPDLKEEYLTYMPYTAITAKGTPHYKLKTVSSTDSEGYRVYDGYRLVALASFYGVEIGTLYNIHFDDGKILRAILGDNKSDAHTDSTKRYRDATGAYDGNSGNIVEIIFDPSVYQGSKSEVMNKVNRKINSDYPGKVVGIEKVGKVSIQ